MCETSERQPCCGEKTQRFRVTFSHRWTVALKSGIEKRTWTVAKGNEVQKSLLELWIVKLMNKLWYVGFILVPQWSESCCDMLWLIMPQCITQSSKFRSLVGQHPVRKDPSVYGWASTQPGKHSWTHWYMILDKWIWGLPKACNSGYIIYI